MSIRSLLLTSPLLVSFAFPLGAVTITLDYTYDTGNFFGSSGSAQRTSLEAARDFFQNTIDQDFNAINPTGSQTWTAAFLNPATGDLETIVDLVVPENEIIIYVGGRNLGGSTLGQAGAGGFTTANFSDPLRGDSAAKYALWGGSASFDSSGTTWNFDLGGPAPSTSDFYSVALHELAHVLGLSANNDAWNDHWVPGNDPIADGNPGTLGQFTGVNAVAAYNADNALAASFVPTVAAILDDPSTTGPGNNEEDLTNRHFEEGTQSFIYGTTSLQEAAMDPNLTQGTRKEFTNVDIGAFQDIGWLIIPEPTSAALLILGSLFALRRRR